MPTAALKNSISVGAFGKPWQVRTPPPLGHPEISAIAGSIGALDLAILVLDDLCRPAFANARAERLLRKGTAILLDGSGAVRCRDRAAQSRLRLLISGKETGRDNAIEFLALPRLEGTPLAALVAPCSEQTFDLAENPGRATLLVRDPEQETLLNSAHVAALFELSDAEADVVCRLTSGFDLPEIAHDRGVSLVTIRNQLKSVQAKMGVRRQAELVSVVLRTLQF